MKLQPKPDPELGPANTSVFIPPFKKAALKDLGLKIGWTLSDLIRFAVDELLKNAEVEERDA